MRHLLLLTGMLAVSLSAATETSGGFDVHGSARVGDKPAVHAVVWLAVPSGTGGAPGGRVVLDQRNLSFAPRVLVVRVGTTVELPNNDRVFHNVFSFRDGKRFDLGLYPVGTLRRVTFDHAGLSRIFCNIHPNMAAYVMAVDTPHYGGRATRAAAFSIPAVAGRHATTYHAWRPGADETRPGAARSRRAQVARHPLAMRSVARPSCRRAGIRGRWRAAPSPMLEIDAGGRALDRRTSPRRAAQVACLRRDSRRACVTRSKASWGARNRPTKGDAFERRTRTTATSGSIEAFVERTVPSGRCAPEPCAAGATGRRSGSPPASDHAYIGFTARAAHPLRRVFRPVERLSSSTASEVVARYCRGSRWKSASARRPTSARRTAATGVDRRGPRGRARGNVIVGASYIRHDAVPAGDASRTATPSFGGARRPLDARSGVQVRGEWLDGQPFDGTHDRRRVRRPDRAPAGDGPGDGRSPGPSA